MTDREVDILVIGAGPAGSWAAKHAAEAGVRTLLVEQRAEIGTPVRCGEGVAGEWLEEAGVPLDPSFIAHPWTLARVIAPDGSRVVVDLAGKSKGGYVIERDRFDRFLTRQAVKAGARVLIRTTALRLLRREGRFVGARCEHFGELFDIHARVVVGADGFEGQVGRWAGLASPLRPRDIRSYVQYTLVGVEGEPECADFYLGSVAPGGYAWVFWKGQDEANVGLGASAAEVRGLAPPEALLDRFLARQPGLARGEPIRKVAGAVGVGLPLGRSIGPGLLLVGDAARLADPLFGAGIRNALLSGMYGGQVAAAAVQAGDVSEEALEAYERKWHSRLEGELARHHLLKEALRELDDPTINRILRALAETRPPRVDAKSVLGVLAERCPEVLERLPAPLD